MRFKVLAGRYVEGKGDNRRTYKAGDVVDSPIDLAAKFGRNKFERLDAPRYEVPRAGKKSAKQPQPAAVGAPVPDRGSVEVENVAPPVPTPQSPPSPRPTPTHPAPHPPKPPEKPAVSQAEMEELNKMSIPELQKLAASEEIDTRGLRSKDAFIAAIRKAREAEVEEEEEEDEEDSE